MRTITKKEIVTNYQPIEKEANIKYFIAEDGKEFKNKEDCEYYEKNLKIKNIETITFDNILENIKIYKFKNKEEQDLIMPYNLLKGINYYYNGDAIYYEKNKTNYFPFLEENNYPKIVGTKYEEYCDSFNEFYIYDKNFLEKIIKTIFKDIDNFNYFIVK